jgi:hypothetical protein
VPVPGLIVVEQLHPERAHRQIILEFRSSSRVYP